MKSYSELMTFDSFEDRFRYLMLKGIVGEETFGRNRLFNQILYHSAKWHRFKNEIIVRDNGCDLGAPGHEIFGPVLIHHINPITVDDVLQMRHCVFDPDNVISTQLSTHNAIHYGDESLVLLLPKERRPNDTIPWKQ